MAATEERTVWHPTSLEEENLVRRALADVIASPHFCNSKRYPAFLEYVVNAVLAGRADELKERTLGMEVFGRRPDYDTNSDTVVRYTAGEVRKRLSLYYSDTGASSTVRIHLLVGSYVPEILLLPREELQFAVKPSFLPELVAGHNASDEPSPSNLPAPPKLTDLQGPDEQPASSSTARPELSAASAAPEPARPFRTASRWLVIAAVMVLTIVAVVTSRHWTAGKPADTTLIQFWAPTLKAPGSKLICTGASVFAPNHLSGVATAPKDTDYPFLSVQIAESIAHLSGFLERHDATFTLSTSADTPLTDLRDRPIILLGAYNNGWSLRLLNPLRFHFAPEPAPAAIVDREQPSRIWSRDSTQGYGNADDYAIAARFTDSTTHGPVVVLAGLGRNGTEAATQFVTAPQFLQDYMREHALPENANVEFVLHSRVIDGKTGAPSIEAVYTW